MYVCIRVLFVIDKSLAGVFKAKIGVKIQAVDKGKPKRKLGTQSQESKVVSLCTP